MFNSLLKAFEKVQSTHEKADETMFEICGFPHYENVVSNVLAFFFDDKNNHNLKGLLAKSLLEASEIPDSNLDLQFRAEREVRTESGGFIDLLLSNDSCCIVLENKIWASLNNDLNDYIEHAKKRDKEKTIGIVLSMWKLDPKHPDFVNVTYSKLISKIRGNIGHFIGRKNNQYLFLLIDLMNNLENMYERGISMNSDFINFVRQNRESVQRFGVELKTYHDDLRKVVKQVNAIVIELIQDSSVRQWPWRNLPELYDVAVTDFDIENGVSLAIDAVVDPIKWEFQVSIRKNPGVNFTLVDFCIAKGLKGNVDGARFILSETLPLETDPTDVAKKIIGLIKSLKA